ncbi:unnamed protein product [Menidia menidia]|uniref:(Atlantic silverside) hypothetical protein n=1 Tax=Menidia menidia TaxID=238744 RepID=A0A8S4BKG8_9TELE|nr:unnamed protein product [Menidia menidia]
MTAMAHISGHGRLLLQRLHQQREMDFLCDVTIMVKDVEFRAHRNILAAFSSYFSSQAEKGQEITTLDPDKSKLSQDNKGLVSIPEGEPPNPEPVTPGAKVSAPPGATGQDPAAIGGALAQDFKAEPSQLPLSSGEPVGFETEGEHQTINSDTLHALVEQLRPQASPAQSLEQIVIIRTVDAGDAAAANQQP